MRLIRDGSYGTLPPRLHLAQNEPFIPMVSAWAARRRNIIPTMDMPDAAESIKKVMSDVLTNRNPPYGIRGGLFDALADTRGLMYGITNAAGHKAEKLIQDTLGIDPDPAAAIATAALIEAVEKDIMKPDDHILLNLTGGGYEQIREDFVLHPVLPLATVLPDEPRDALIVQLKEWIRNHG
jgi:cysteate synthase